MKHKTILLLFLLPTTIVNVLYSQTIGSFSPVSGNVGTSVVITGTNFSNIPSDNLVRFGAVKATVTSAGTTTLMVTVPAGASYGPLTVQVAGAVACSGKYFIPTFSPGKQAITAADLISKIDFTTGVSPTSLAIADLDGDGKPDMVIANNGSQSISVYRNIAISGTINNSTFESKVDFAVGTNPSSVAITDLDGDGKLDLAVCNFGSNTISVLRNTSTAGTIDAGSFAPKVDFTTGTNPTCLAIGDLDIDGKPELAVTNGGSNTISVLRNTATAGTIDAGSFAPKVDFTTGANPFSVALGDLNEDGKPELAVANKNAGSVSVLRNTSSPGAINSGSFAVKVDFSVGTNPNAIAIGDLEGDGKAELCTANYGSNTVSVLRNTSGTGYISFSSKKDFSTGTNPFAVAIGDIDGDGKPDIAVSNNGNSTISVLRNKTVGSILLSSFAIKVDFTCGSGPNGAAVHDIDGDGRPDLVAANAGSNTVSVLRNNPIFFPTLTSFSPLSGAVGAVVTINGTNFDLVPGNNLVRFGATVATVTAATSSQLIVTVPPGATYDVITVKVGDRTASSPKPFVLSFTPGKQDITAEDFLPDVAFDLVNPPGYPIYPTNSKLCDIDGDGKSDVVVGDGGNYMFTVFRNTSVNGTLSLAAPEYFPLNGYQITLDDFDADGKVDIAGDFYGNISVVRNTSTPGNISFGNEIGLSSANSNDIETGDVDGDGKPDLILANSNNTVSVFRNTSSAGAISFAPKVDFNTGTNPVSLAVADLDGNGKIEIVTANYGTNTVSILKNQSVAGIITTGSFAAKVDCSTGVQPNNIATGDLDGDGKVDIVVSNSGSATLSVLQNQTYPGQISNGAFPKFDLPNAPTSGVDGNLGISDMDGDGKPDLIVCGSQTIKIYRNASQPGSIFPGSFATTAALLSTNGGCETLALGDLNGDGKNDIITSEGAEESISVFINKPVFFPTISAVAPVSGLAGTTVIIQGTNYSTTPAENLVRFGATLASVIAATATQLTVTVPSGATFSPVTVQVAGRKAYSGAPFLPTFSPGKPSFAISDLDPKVDFSAGANPQSVATGDLDGDGKPDMVVVNKTGNSVSIYRSTASAGSISAASFETPVNFNTGAAPVWVILEDIDLDGKPDIVVANSGAASVSVLRNTSTSGSITSGSFAPKVNFTTGNNPQSVAAGDLDGDGRPDLVTANYSGNTVSVLRNKSVAGSVLCASKIDFPTGANPRTLAVGDLDNDGKPELAVTNFAGNTLSVLRNTCTIGTISGSSFAAKVDFSTGSSPWGIALGDLDGDHKNDLAVSNVGSASVSVFRNIASTGVINTGSLAAKVDFTSGSGPRNIAFGDMNGDGKTDLIVVNNADTTVSVFRNTCTPGSIDAGSFAAKVDAMAGADTYGLVVADLDGDGKTDITTGSAGANSFSVLRNNLQFIAGFSLTTGALANEICTGSAISVGYTCTGSLNAGNVFTAQMSDANGSFAAPIAIGTLNASSSGAISCSIPANTAPGTGYRIRVASSDPAYFGADNGSNIYINAVPAAPAAISGVSTVLAGSAYTYTVTPIANAVSYQWTYTGSGATISDTGASVTVNYSMNASAGELSVACINTCGTGLAVTKTIAVYANTSFLGFELVKDVNTGSGNSSFAMYDPVVFNGKIYFHNNIALWRTDGTSQGTVKVFETELISFTKLTVCNNKLYFIASTAETGAELWSYDGVSAFPELVKDIYSGHSGSQIQYLIVLGNNLYFAADDGINGQELWKSDGTPGGTGLVKDIYPGSEGASVQHITVFSGKIYFAARASATSGMELWVSDGTATGTYQLADIYPQPTASSFPSNFFVFQSKLYFSATSPSYGAELWMTDGTPTGTVMVKDIRPGSAYSSPAGLIAKGSYLYFSANDGTTGTELWRSNGLVGNAELVKDIRSGSNSSNPASFTVHNTKLYFTATDGASGNELWVSDGNVGNANLVEDINTGSASSSPGNLVSTGNGLFFKATEPTTGNELWISTDGTAGNTYLIEDIFPGVSGSGVGSLALLGSSLYFSANDGVHGNSLWKSEGLESNTLMVSALDEVPKSSSPDYLTAVGSSIFFVANQAETGTEIWKTDGSSAGTNMVNELPGNQGSIYISPLEGIYPKALNGNLLFCDLNGLFWKTDGTNAGTGIVSDIVQHPTTNHDFGFYPSFFEVLNGNVYFGFLETGWLQWQVYKSDGVSSLDPVTYEDNFSNSAPSNLKQVGNYIFFGFGDNTFKEPWVTNGGPAYPIIYPNPLNIKDPSDFTGLNGYTYYLLTHPTYGRELFRSTAVQNSLQLFADIRSGTAGSFPEFLTPAENITPQYDALFFTADDGIKGRELWVSVFDTGSTAPLSTYRVRDINPGSAGSGVTNLAYLNGLLFFTANNGVNGAELWVSHGDSAGTYMLRDINCGTAGSVPRDFLVMNGWVYFTADDGVHGRELWRTDGTEGGTALVGDLRAGSSSANPDGFLVHNNILYFSADDGNYGVELWKFNPALAAAVAAGPVAGTDICPGDTIPVPYSITGAFNGGNIFTVQLSDGSGCFDSPINVGTKLSNTAGVINAVIPSGLTAGSQYRFQIVSSNPPSIPVISPTLLTAKYYPDAGSVIYGNQHVSPGQSGLVYSAAPLAGANSYLWSYSGSGVTINGSGTTVNLSFSAGATSGNLSFRGANDCGLGEPATLPVYVSDINLATAGKWDSIPVFNGISRSGAISMTIGNKGYFGGGKSGNTYLDDFWEYDPVNNTWTQRANIGGGGRANAVAFSIGNRGFVGTGNNGSAGKNDFWEYNPATDTWTAKAGVPGGPRWSAAGFSISNKGYIGSGNKGALSAPTTSNDFCEYDPVANQWVQVVNAIPVAREGAVGFSIGNTGYVATGHSGSAYLSDFYAYNPSSQVWTLLPAFPGGARKDAVGVYMCNKGYIGTGKQDTSDYRDFWEYNPANGTWKARQNLGAAGRQEAAAFAIKDQLWAGTGRHGTVDLGDFKKFSPSFINDEPQDAVLVPISATNNCDLNVIGSTLNATQTLPACTAGQFADDDVWYKFTAIEAVHVLRIFNFTEPLGFEIFSGVPGNLTSITCSPTSGNLFVMNNLTVGTLYYIRVYTSGNTVSSEFSLCIDSYPDQAVNDECLSATILSVATVMECTPATYSTSQATQSASACAASTHADDDVWFKFKPKQTVALITLQNISPIPAYANSGNLVMEMFQGVCASLNSMQCKVITEPDLFTFIIPGLDTSQYYYLRFYSSANTGYLSFQVCISSPPDAPNNDFCPLPETYNPINPGYFCEFPFEDYTTAGASSVWPNNGCSGDDTFDEVWWLFEATWNSHVVSFENVNVVFGANTAANKIMGVQLYNSCQPSGFLSCATVIADNKYLFSGLTPNSTYYLRVFSKAEGVYCNFDICVLTPPPLPVNDTCNGAINLPVNSDLNCTQFLSGTTNYATYTTVTGSCGQANQSDVWYKFTTTQTSYVLSLKNIKGVEFGAAGNCLNMELFSGSCGSLQSVLCETDSVFFLSGLQSGATYYIRISLPPGTGVQELFANFDICLCKTPTAPDNDECAGAAQLSVSGEPYCTTAVEGTTEGATRSDADCSGQISDDDVWYWFTATGTEQVVSVYGIEKIKGAGDVYLEVLEGATCNALTALTCTREGILRLGGLSPGSKYYVRIFTGASNSYQRFRICLSTPPLNDVCNSSTNISLNTNNTGCRNTTLSGSTLGANLSSADDCNVINAQDVWYQFTANATHLTISLYNIHQEIVSTGVIPELYFAVFTGSCGNLTQVGCQQNGNYLVLNNLIQGQNCYLKVYSSAGKAYTFNVCISAELPVQTNNNCQTALDVPIDNSGFCSNAIEGSTYTTLTTSNAAESGCTYADVPVNDLTWYKFTASGNLHSVKVIDVASQTGGAVPVYHQVYSGTCAGGLTTLNCLSDVDSSRYDNLVNGLTYYIKVGKEQTVSGQASFKVCVTVPDTVAGNNTCSGATLLTVDAAPVTGNTLYGTQSMLSCVVDNSANEDLWYRFSATESKHRIEVTDIVPSGASSISVIRELYGGSSCTGLYSLSCSETDIIAEGLIPGVNYYLRVYTRGDRASATYKIRIRTLSSPPVNDHCTGASMLPVNALPIYANTTVGTTVNATESKSPCLGIAADDVWYVFTATGTNASIQISPQAGYAYVSDIVHQVFMGSCAVLTPFSACLEGTSSYLNGLTVGASYYVRVYERSGLHPFSFDIGLIQYPETPTHDDCGSAVPVPVNGGTNCSSSLSTTNSGATASSAGDCSAGIFCDDVYYSFTATSTAHLVQVNDVLSLTTTSLIDSFGFTVYSACVNGPVSIFSKKSLLTGLTPGNAYFIRAGSKGTGGVFNYSVCITSPAFAVNDSCNTAQLITANTGLQCVTSYNGTTLQAKAGPPACAGGVAKDVWYKFKATATAHMVNITDAVPLAEGDFNAVHQVYSGNCNGLVSLACTDSDTSLLTGLMVDSMYYIRLYSQDTAVVGTFNLCISTPEAAPLNDHCTGSVTIPVNTGKECVAYTSGFTFGATQSLPGCNGDAGDDVWFKFTALTSAHEIKLFEKQVFNTNGSNASLILQVFEDSCSAMPVSLVCSATEQAALTNLIPGQTYFVRVYTAAETGVAMFKICVTTQYLPASPVNDHLGGAVSLVQQDEGQCTQGYASWGSIYYSTTDTLPVCKGASAYDVWYKFVALSNTVTLKIQGKTNLVTEVWNQNPLTLRNCIDSTAGAYAEIKELYNLQPGATYYVRVYPYSAISGIPPVVYNVVNSAFSISVCGDSIQTSLLEAAGIDPALIGNVISGYTVGNFSSTETGSAIYSIPIAIPSGSGGMQPDLGMVYNSQGGNSLMGVGWSLSGFSVISRNGKTLAQDGAKRGINYSDQDRYILDGEKLVNITALSYGADGCEYRTEQQSFKRVISYGNVNGTGTPQKFKVWTKDGLIYEYGYTTDSRVEAQNRHEAVYWLVNKITDTKGNYILFTYEEDAVNGTYYPLRVDYTGNTSTGLLPYCHVEFGYEPRPDTGEAYHHGSASRSTKRMSRITAYYESQKAREYKLAYKDGSYDKVSMLTSIQEFGSDGKCFAPTLFKWQDGTTFFEQLPNVISNLFPVEILGNGNALFREADFSGDGLSDLFTYDRTTNQSKLYLNNGNYNFSDSTKTGIFTLSADEIFDVIDFNGDGFSDFYIQDTVTGHNRWLEHNRSLTFSAIGFSQSINKIPAGILERTPVSGVKFVQFLDLNGDGSSDAFIKAHKDSMFLKVYTNSGTGNFFDGMTDANLFAGEFSFADLDNDGLVDVLTIDKSTNKNSWYQNQSNASISNEVGFIFKKSNVFPPETLPANSVFNMGDWNGDGVTDMAVFGEQQSGLNTTFSAIQWYINKGNGVFKPLNVVLPVSISGTYQPEDMYFLPYDINADGKDDFLNYKNATGELKIFLNDGNGNFTNNYRGHSLTGLINPALLAGGGGVKPVNYRHNNVFSLFWWTPTTGENRVVDILLDLDYGRVDTIVNGLGQMIALNYSTITDKSVYERGNSSVYPEYDFFGSYKVLTNYCIKNPDGSTTKVMQKYKKGKMNMQGRGFRGFDEVETIDDTKGVRSFSFRDSDTRYLSAPVVLSQIFQPNGNLLHESEQINVLDSLVNPNHPMEKTYWSYSKEIIQRNYELDGSLASTIKKRQSIDINGNTQYTVVDYGSGVIDSTVFSYTDNVSMWHLGRLTHSTMYRILPGKTTAVRNIAIEYDPISGLKTKEIAEPDSSAENKITKEYFFDAYGNIIRSATVAWNGTATETRNLFNTYDNKGRFSLTISNDLGHTNTYTYHPVVGLPITETDPNGLTKTYEYDGFGRVIKETMPDGNWAKYRYYKCITGNCPGNASHYILKESSVDPPGKNYLDLMNRIVAEEESGFNGNPTYEISQYDQRGLLVASSDPHFPGEPVLWTMHEYDLLNRLTKEIAPGNLTTKYEYKGLLTTVINALGQRKSEMKAADGRVLSVTDNSGKSILYEYDARRNLIKITDSQSNDIVFEYDFYNFKTKTTDPDIGIYTYKVNRFGELLEQTYPGGQTVSMQYDTIGRLIKRTEPEGTARWKYDSKPFGIGLIDSVSLGDYYQSVYYDSLSRIKRDRYKISNQLYDYDFKFDSIGRFLQMDYPMGFGIKYKYNDANMLSEISNSSNGQLYYKIDDLNSYGQPVSVTYGNGVTTKYDFDPEKRWLLGLYAAKDTNIIQNLAYTYDNLTNVNSKTNLKRAYKEQYTYDNLNRLINYSIDDIGSTTMAYDELGNITYKSDVGQYYYGENGHGPHQLSRVTGNANVCIPSALTQFFYTSYNMVKEIKNDSMSLAITYGAGRERIDQRVYKQGILQQTKIYAGSALEIVSDSTGTKRLYYIRGLDGVMMVHTVANDSISYDQYWHRDNQDNLHVVSNSNGVLIEELNYDPWGKRRNLDGSPLDSLLPTLSARGYTGHEHYDFMGLINMNGRIQDPVLGRFVSPDPFIQDISNMQNLNRYSYVLNNPMSITDPSGFLDLMKEGKKILNNSKKALAKAKKDINRELKKAAIKIAKPLAGIAKSVEQATGINLRDPVSIAVAALGPAGMVFNKQITSTVNDFGSKTLGEDNWNKTKVVASMVAVSIATGGAGTLASGAVTGFTGAYVGTAVSGGSYEDAFYAGTYAAGKGAANSYLAQQYVVAANGISNFTQQLGQSVGPGVLQGMSNMADGGKFEHGFIAATNAAATESVTEYFSLTPGSLSTMAFDVATGGTNAVVGGGKFLNGAKSGLANYLYNQVPPVVKESFAFNQKLQFDLPGLMGLPSGLPNTAPLTEGGQWNIMISSMLKGVSTNLESQLTGIRAPIPEQKSKPAN